jgi:hypothetical protein
LKISIESYDMNKAKTILQKLKPVILLVSLNMLLTNQAFAAGNDNNSTIEAPCFFVNSSDKILWNDQFSTALASDIERGRKKLDAIFEKAMPDVTGNICSEVDRVAAREKTSLLAWYDQTLSKGYIYTRLQKVWNKRWSPKLCGLVEKKILAKNMPIFTKLPNASVISLQEKIEDFLTSLIQTDWLETTGTRSTIVATLEDMKTELNTIAQETNIRLNIEVPRRLKTTRDASIKAIEQCIADEEAKLK